SVLLEPVHLGEDLVEGLLALVVPAADTGATAPTDGVELVYEDDGRRRLASLFEQAAHATSTDAYEHLHELGSADGQERHARLAGNGACQQGLACAWRADEKHALGYLGSD